MNDFNDLVEAGTLRPPFLISLRVACPTLTTTIRGTGRLETPLYNGPGNDSWPIPFITFLALKQNITAADCTPTKELLNFIAWTQINDQAISAVSDMGYMPLAFAYRSKLIDLLGRITCNGDQALPTAYLLGLGSGLPVYTDWSLTYSNTQTNLKIYTDLTRKAPLEQITSGQAPDVAADAGALCVHRPHFSRDCWYGERRCGRFRDVNGEANGQPDGCVVGPFVDSSRGDRHRACLLCTPSPTVHCALRSCSSIPDMQAPLLPDTVALREPDAGVHL
jgi:hypothetical protein